MSNAIIAAGYIVVDNEAIHGTGPTADAAWADMLETMKEGGIEVLDDDADSTEQQGGWTRASSFKIRAASAVLIAAVKERGGDIGWHDVGGVCCTRDEEEG